jgi:hypothetical protein
MGQGLTDNYIRVVSPQGAGLWNRFSEVELVELAAEGVVGRLMGGSGGAAREGESSLPPRNGPLRASAG